jgi:2-aminoethylphosphonate transport system permease protein
MAVWVNACGVIARASGGPLADPVPCVRPHELRLAAPYEVNALSMGELGATVMLYPPFWVTAPVRVFALTDRGAMFAGAAPGTILLTATFATLRLLDRSWGTAR